jgi:hypothetical protein
LAFIIGHAKPVKEYHPLICLLKVSGNMQRCTVGIAKRNQNLIQGYDERGTGRKNNPIPVLQQHEPVGQLYSRRYLSGI